MDINLNITVTPSDKTPAWAQQLLQQIGVIIEKENKIMTAVTDALDAAEAAATANSKADDAAEALLISISAMVSDLKNNQTDPATVDRINALATAINDRAAKLGVAVVANTPTA